VWSEPLETYGRQAPQAGNISTFASGYSNTVRTRQMASQIVLANAYQK